MDPHPPCQIRLKQTTPFVWNLCYDFRAPYTPGSRISHFLHCFCMVQYWNFKMTQVCFYKAKKQFGILFICFKGSGVGMPTLPDKSNPYLQGSLSVGIAKFPLREHSTNLPCRRKYYGLRTSTILYLLHLTLAPDHWFDQERWVFEDAGLWLNRLVISLTTCDYKVFKSIC